MQKKDSSLRSLVPQLTRQFVLDQKLWSKLVSLLPIQVPSEAKLPLKLGAVDGCTVYLVNGKSIAARHPVFWRGGHGYVYPSFIPLNEIWIDAQEDRIIWPFVLYHEVIERRLMVKGWLYEAANEVALDSEPE